MFLKGIKLAAKTSRSRRSKGSDFQKVIAEKIRDYFGLEERDVVSTPNSQKGVDVLMSNRAKELFNYSMELKRQESISMWKWLEQAEANATDESPPLLIFKRNRSDVYCCLKFEDFISLFKKEV